MKKLWSADNTEDFTLQENFWMLMECVEDTICNGHGQADISVVLMQRKENK